MRVKAFICPRCGAGVYVRVAKDFRTCTCSALGVSGTPDKPLLSIGSSAAGKVKVVELNLKATEKDLGEDWSNMEDQFGLLQKGDAALKKARPIKASELTEHVQTTTKVGPDGQPIAGDDEDEGEGGEEKED